MSLDGRRRALALIREAFPQATWHGQRAASVAMRGSPVHLEVKSDQDGAGIHVRIPIAEPPPLWLTVANRRIVDLTLALPEVELGNAALEAKHLVRGVPAWLVRQALDDPLCAAMAEHLPAPFALEARNGEVTAVVSYRSDFRLLQSEALPRIIDTLVYLAIRLSTLYRAALQREHATGPHAVRALEEASRAELLAAELKSERRARTSNIVTLIFVVLILLGVLGTFALKMPGLLG